MEANSPNASEVNSPYTVVWDIDDVIAGKRCKDLSSVYFFSQQGAVLHVLATHYIFPGIKEFFGRLDLEPNLRLAFFSSGVVERGVSLCPQLLERFLNQERAEVRKKSTPIFSREDLEKQSTPRRQFELVGGSLGKNLRKVIPEEETLENVVLIEDDESYVLAEQEPNFLEVPSIKSTDFEDMNRPSKLAQWTVDGKFLPKAYVGSSQSSVRSHEGNAACVSKGEFIRLHKLESESEEAYEIEFKARGREEYQIAKLDSNSPLFQKIKEAASASRDPSFYTLENGSEVLQELHLWIREQGGEIPVNTIYHETNKVYYAAGILFTAMERAKTEKRPLSAVLLEIQYKWDEEKQKYVGQFERLRNENYWYVRGLEELRKVNPRLTFMHPHLYQKIISTPLSAEEKAVLQKYIDAEDKEGCVVQ